MTREQKKLIFPYNSEYLNREQIKFLTGLFFYCEKLERTVEKLSAHFEISKRLIKDLAFFQRCYNFLKSQKDTIKVNELIFSEVEEKKLENIYKKENSFGKFKYAFNKSKIDTIILRHERELKILGKTVPEAYEKLYTVNLNIGEIYEDLMGAKMLIYYLMKKKCTKKMVDNILFNIHFRMYVHIVPNHFENIDESHWGIISQIDWLTNHLNLFTKLMPLKQ